MDDGNMPEAETDFGMVRAEELLADAEGLHMALLGTEEIVALAKNGAEVGGDESGLAMHSAMAA
jgi:hypothetical protein